MCVGVLLEPTSHRVDVGRREHADGARVYDRGHPLATTLDGLEHVDGPRDIDLGTERRVGTTEGHLQRGEVDDVRDAVVVEGALDGREIGDVADDEIDAREVRRLHDELDPAGIAAEIEGDDRHALAQQLTDRPCPDATEGARDEEALAVPAGRAGHAAAPDTASTRHTFSSTPIPSISTLTRSPSAR